MTARQQIQNDFTKEDKIKGIKGDVSDSPEVRSKLQIYLDPESSIKCIILINNIIFKIRIGLINVKTDLSLFIDNQLKGEQQPE